jgi:hypothetical protein
MEADLGVSLPVAEDEDVLTQKPYQPFNHAAQALLVRRMRTTS